MGEGEPSAPQNSRQSWSEARLHHWLRERWSQERPDITDPRVGSFGHDAAVLADAPGRPVLCVDQTLEGVHFEAGTAGHLVGRKAAARALSDLAATAAQPVALLLSMHAPADCDEAWMRAAIEGVDAMGLEVGARLVGGDLASCPGPIGLGVSAWGRIPSAGQPPGRDRACAGDVVLLTGPVGGSRNHRHLEIQPRIEAGLWLHAGGARVLMDVSDGLSLDLGRIAAASGMRIELDHVPVHRDAEAAAQRDGRSAIEHALSDGEDHELLACLPAERWRALSEEAGQRFPDIERIGRVCEGEGLWMCIGGSEPTPMGTFGGWQHGG